MRSLGNKSNPLNSIPENIPLSPGYPAAKIAETINAVRLHVSGGPAGLVYEQQIQIPPVKAGEVLVRVYAAAITRDELDWPTNRLPAIPSYEFSGVVAALAPDVEDIAIGEGVPVFMVMET